MQKSQQEAVIISGDIDFFFIITIIYSLSCSPKRFNVEDSKIKLSPKKIQSLAQSRNM